MLKQPLRQVQGDVVQHDGGSATSNENIVNDEENDVDDMKNHTPKTRQRETLTQYARESLPATSRSSLDDEDMAKNAAKHPMFKTPNEEDDELLLRAFAHNTRTRQYAENEYSGTKSDEGKDYSLIEKESKDKIFERVLARTLGEEGGYEYKKKRIDQSTNMGIRQSTLNSFKKSYPREAANFPQSVVNLTRSQVSKIARRVFFDKYRIAEIHNESLQETMFDSFFNHSPEAPALWAQKAINKITRANVMEDGIFGTETIGALNGLNAREIKDVNNAIIDMRLDNYEQERKTNKNPYYKDYTKGLPSRFERFRIK